MFKYIFWVCLQKKDGVQINLSHDEPEHWHEFCNVMNIVEPKFRRNMVPANRSWFFSCRPEPASCRSAGFRGFSAMTKVKAAEWLIDWAYGFHSIFVLLKTLTRPGLTVAYLHVLRCGGLQCGCWSLMIMALLCSSWEWLRCTSGSMMTVGMGSKTNFNEEYWY